MPAASLVALGDSQLGLRSFLRYAEVGSGQNRVRHERSQGSCDAVFERPRGVCAASLRNRLKQFI